MAQTHSHCKVYKPLNLEMHSGSHTKTTILCFDKESNLYAIYLAENSLQLLRMHLWDCIFVVQANGPSTTIAEFSRKLENGSIRSSVPSESISFVFACRI